MRSIRSQFKSFAMSNVAHIYIKTMEYDRAESMVAKGCSEIGIDDLYRYSIVTGLRKHGGDRIEEVSSTDDLRVFILGLKRKSAVIIQDIHLLYDDQLKMATLSEIIDYAAQETPVLLVGLSASNSIPDEFLLKTYIIDLPLPKQDEIAQFVQERFDTLGLHVSAGTKKMLSASLSGLSVEEIEVLLNRVTTDAMASGRHISIDSVELINEQKKQVIQKSGLVEFMTPDVDIDSVGGLYRLKRWLKDRKVIYEDMEFAEQNGLKPPRGILMFGAPGAGKSLTAKVIASYYTLPLLRVDMGLIFGHRSPEEAISRVTQLADTIAPCILFIDELEKALAGSENGSADPVAVKMLGILLTWMQERTSPVFVVATANDISMIRPETYRDGRVDEKFFLGFLDDETQVEQIINIHIRMRLKDQTDKIVRPLDYRAIFKRMMQRVEYYGGHDKAGFSGANVEALVIKVLENRFFRGQEYIETKDFIRALGTLRPQHGFAIAQMMKRAADMDAITA